MVILSKESRERGAKKSSPLVVVMGLRDKIRVSTKSIPLQKKKTNFRVISSFSQHESCEFLRRKRPSKRQCAINKVNDEKRTGDEAEKLIQTKREKKKESTAVITTTKNTGWAIISSNIHRSHHRRKNHRSDHHHSRDGHGSYNRGKWSSRLLDFFSQVLDHHSSP